MKQALYKSYEAFRCDRVVYAASRNRLRILTYHGVCDDHVVAQGWVPPYFVTSSAFQNQLAYLKRNTHVLPLYEALIRLQHKKLPSRCVAVTFDDGYANNLHLAYPLLKKCNIPATIFLATSPLESCELFHYDRIHLARFFQGRSMDDGTEDFWLGYRSKPLDTVFERLETEWRKVEPQLSQEQRDTLRPLRVDELDSFESQLIEFGSHTHRHPILSQESPSVRAWEILTSIEKVEAWTGRQVRLFAYPNGAPGDFGELDKQTLRAAGVEAAFSTIPGSNARGGDLYEMRRYGVGLNHSTSAFVAEVTGFRHLLLSLAGRN